MRLLCIISISDQGSRVQWDDWQHPKISLLQLFCDLWSKPQYLLFGPTEHLFTLLLLLCMISTLDMLFSSFRV